MILKLIGLRRVFMLAILAGANIAIAMLYLFVLDPMLEDSKRELSKVEGAISSSKSKISKIKQDMQYVSDNLGKYQELQDKGLFLEQDRFMIERLLHDMRIRSGIQGFSFAIDDLTETPNSDAASIKHKLVTSNIRVSNIDSTMDANVFVFLQNIADSFPERARLSKFEMRRVAEVSEKTLDELRSGKKVRFVEAATEFEWTTMVPVEEPKKDGATEGFRGR